MNNIYLVHTKTPYPAYSESSDSKVIVAKSEIEAKEYAFPREESIATKIGIATGEYENCPPDEILSNN
jgi:hypothetical protein